MWTDFLLCVVSIAIAAIFQLPTILIRLWPYILLLISFAGFVFWNGGVVLGIFHSLLCCELTLTSTGDKSNHVATIHLPQMLYIWPFITFFSAPLILPVGISFLRSLFYLLAMPLFPRLIQKYLLVSVYVVISLASTLVIIKYNTIIHPFTLADNRHYMFYVFRYSILRHPLIRYALAPIYLGCAYLVYLTLSGPSSKPSHPALKQTSSKDDAKKELEAPKPNVDEAEGPTTSFLIILLATTALSLITAPLVEPRYFIIPWVIWRLHVPPLAKHPSESKRKPSQRPSDWILDFIRYWGWEGHDYRLWLETAWFLLINVVTGYVFLHRGFEWPREPGKVQRFMW